MVLDTLIKVKKEIMMGTPTPSLPKAMAILARGIVMGNGLKHRLDAEMRVPVGQKPKRKPVQASRRSKMLNHLIRLNRTTYMSELEEAFYYKTLQAHVPPFQDGAFASPSKHRLLYVEFPSQLKHRCTKELGQRLTIKNVVDVLQLAKMCDAANLYLKCLKSAANHFKVVGQLKDGSSCKITTLGSNSRSCNSSTRSNHEEEDKEA
ncbi:hypothetical protein ACFX2B_013329 [Malus domestica]